MVLILASLPVMTSCAQEAAAPAPAPQKSEPFTVKLSYAGAGGTSMDQYYFFAFKDYIEEITQGRATGEYYPGGVLHDYPGALKAVESGLTDHTMVWNPAMPGRFPLMDLFHLPGLMPRGMAVGNMIMLELWDKFPQFEEQYESDKFVNLFTGLFMGADICAVKAPILSLEDLKGKIIACQTGTGAAALEQLGAETTVMVGTDAYIAAERGVVDGVFAAWGWILLFKMWEVAPYHTLIGIGPGTVSWPFNMETFEKFTPYEQNLLLEWREKGQAGITRGALFQGIAGRAARTEKDFFDLPAADKAKIKEVFRPMWDKWAEDMEALGYPGKEILDYTLFLLREYERS